MFVPRMYREPDTQWMVELMRRNPLALFVTNGADNDGPRGTHLPVVPDPQTPVDGLDDLAGAVLLGHLNRANPQWKALTPGTTAMLSFTGPGAYVSPALYPFSPAAPTWNFTAVQVRGEVEMIESVDETLSVVRTTAGILERDFGLGWDMSGSIGHFRRILPGVGAFRFRISTARSMFKLSQEQDEKTRGHVCSHFAGNGPGAARDTAEYMTALPGAEPG